MNISEVMQLPEGGLVYSLRAFVKSASRVYPGTNTRGNPYTSQSVTLQDQTGTIPAKVWDPSPPLTAGQTVIINATKNGKGQLSGATFGMYNNAPQLSISGRCISVDGQPVQRVFEQPAYPQALQMSPITGGAEPPGGWQGDFPAQRPQEARSAPAPHPTSASATNVTPAPVQTPRTGNPYAMPEQEARARLVGAFKDFVEELGYDPRGLAVIPEPVIEVCGAWATSILIGIQRKDIRPEPLAPEPLFGEEEQ